MTLVDRDSGISICYRNDISNRHWIRLRQRNSAHIRKTDVLDPNQEIRPFTPCLIAYPHTLIGTSHTKISISSTVLDEINTLTAVDTVIPTSTLNNIITRPTRERVIILTTFENIVTCTTQKTIAATVAAQQVIARATINDIIAILAREGIAGRSSQQQIIAVAAADEGVAVAAADEDVVAAAAGDDFDFGLGEVEGHALIADDLDDVGAGSGVDVGLQVIGVDEQNIIAGAGVVTVTAGTTGEPVVAAVADEAVVALGAVGVVDAFEGDVDAFAAGIAGDVARDVALGSDLGASAVGEEAVPIGVGEEVEGEGFFALSILDEAAAGEDFVAVADEAGFPPRQNSCRLSIL